MRKNGVVNGEVVFDPSMWATFLLMSEKEGLIADQPKLTDNFIKHPRQAVQTELAAFRIREQLALSGKVIIPDAWGAKLNSILKGRLIDEGIVEFIDQPEPSSIKLIEFGLDDVDTWLKANGFQDPLKIMLSKFDQVRSDYIEFERTCQGLGLEVPDCQMEIRLMTRRMIEGDHFQNPYPPEVWDEYLRLKECRHAINPLLDAAKSIQTTIAVASSRGSMAGFPTPLEVPKTELPQVRFADDIPGVSDLKLVRFVFTRLQAAPAGATIEESIAIARSTEMESMRHLIHNLKVALESGEAAVVERFEREYELARNSLFNKYRDNRASIVAGTACLGLGIWATQDDKYLNDIGIALTGIGILASVTNGYIPFEHRWIHVGSVTHKNLKKRRKNGSGK